LSLLKHFFTRVKYQVAFSFLDSDLDEEVYMTLPLGYWLEGGGERCFSATKIPLWIEVDLLAMVCQFFHYPVTYSFS